MTQLQDIIDEDQLIRDLDAGYIRVQFHPTFPYAILNYTEKAQYDNHWTSATLNCRGLIYNSETDEIVARPFPKFFNYSQLTDPPAPNTPVVATDKMDGSLGIIYYGPDDSINVATRGSFSSEQALWATKWLQKNHDEVLHIRTYGTTLLVEIIYPGNRIVLDYKDRAELVLLGAVDILDGSIYYGNQIFVSEWSGARTELLPYRSIADTLNAPDRENAEGIVVKTVDNQLIKFKQEDYIKLHRILTGLTERTVYDVLKQEGNVDRLIEIVPDEFHPWVEKVETNLLMEYQGWIAHWEIEYESITHDLPEDATQKDFAMRAVKSECRAAMFLLRKGDTKKLEEMAWKEVRPEATMATAGISDDDS